MTCKRRVLIFGTGQIAELACYYLTHDSPYEVVGFTVDRAYLRHENMIGLPVVAFDEVSEVFPPDDHDMLVALGYLRLNLLRAQKCDEAKAKGYRLASYVSSRATFFSGFAPGENAFILENNVIQPLSSIGRNVTIWSGSLIGHHATIGDHCFISSHVVVAGGVHIGDQTFIGVNATVRDGVTVGDRSVIGAGSLILENVDPLGVYSPGGTQRSRVPSNRLRHV